MSPHAGSAIKDVHVIPLTDEMRVSKTGPAVSERTTVLLIDNHLMVRAGLRLLLEASGLLVSGEASTCEEAAVAIAAQQPDIILIDLDLAKGSFACFADLMSVSPESRIIALADQNRIHDRSTAIELGAFGLLWKHEPADTLTKAIRKVHEGELWLDRITTADVVRRVTRRRRLE